MRERLEYALVKIFLWFAKIMPKSFIYMLTKVLTLLVYHLDGNRRSLTIKNLSLAFPKKPFTEIQKLSRDVYIELSKTIAEILLMYVDRFDIDKAVVNKDEVIGKLQDMTQHSTSGIIAMTAHFSNWELLAHFLAKHGLPMLVIGREGNNKLIEKQITQKFRKKYGNDTASKNKAMLSMIKRLKAGGNVGILIDQKAGGSNSVKVDFFGRLAETTTSIAMLKQKFNPQIVPFFIARVEEGKYKVIIEDAVDYTDVEEKDEEKKLEKMTAKYNEVMESVIRDYPAQWFWMHNRWRL